MNHTQYSSAASVYSEPPTFLEILIETNEMLEKLKSDPLATKENVIESVEQRLSLIIGKLVAVPTHTSFALFRSNKETPRYPAPGPVETEEDMVAKKNKKRQGGILASDSDSSHSEDGEGGGESGNEEEGGPDVSSLAFC